MAMASPVVVLAVPLPKWQLTAEASLATTAPVAPEVPDSTTLPVEAAGRKGTAPGIRAPGIPVPGIPVPGIPVPGIPVPGIPVPGIPVPGIPVPGIRAPVLVRVVRSDRQRIRRDALAQSG